MRAARSEGQVVPALGPLESPSWETVQGLSGGGHGPSAALRIQWVGVRGQWDRDGSAGEEVGRVEARRSGWIQDRV